MDSSDEQPVFTAIFMAFDESSNLNEVVKESWISAHTLIDRVKNQSLQPALDLRAALSKLLRTFGSLGKSASL
ncbi:hypothetical protein GTU79_24640 [Sodalis ligni]|uniref:hypothetical protein n=1 Tax=Sodalis ligni TaxID=2697027 RepID=UPI001BDF6AE4|nr:hypothetical protein [Sodalis ligni]QWA10373.1 hypothetical protein GTU79_24640 [Sodalis ligni]